MPYTPPSTASLAGIKKELGKTGAEMALLAGLSGDQQWRKYTGGKQPRKMSQQMLFFIAAQLTLDKQELQRIEAEAERIRQLA